MALAAALWGTDALFRRGLALDLPATTIVFVEHLLLVILTAPLLLRAVRRAAGVFTTRDWAAVIVIGAGASTTATVLFTMAFASGEVNTPLLMQKLQPVFAVLAARLLLGEVPRRRYAAYFTTAVGGAYLVTFADPAAVRGPTLVPGLLALAAAALWASGTVLGRSLTASVAPAELAALRFGAGLPAATLLLVATGGHRILPAVGTSQWLALVLLTAVPGLAGLLLYYRGLRGTPASAATLAELAFPLSALLVNYLAFGATLTGTQWLGVVVLTAAITSMSLGSSHGRLGMGIDVAARRRGLVGTGAQR